MNKGWKAFLVGSGTSLVGTAFAWTIPNLPFDARAVTQVIFIIVGMIFEAAMLKKA